MQRASSFWLFLFLVMLVSGFTASCNSGVSADQSKGGAPPPPEVSFITVQPEDVDIFGEYSAQTFARDMVEVRGRVDGYIERRLFDVGADVRAGQALYVLDRRPYQAEVAKARSDVEQSIANAEFAKKQVAILQAEADVAQAQANLSKTQQDVTRLQPLVKQEAAPLQDLDNANAAVQANVANLDARKASLEQARLQARTQIDAAGAQVEANKALLQTAQLNLDYASITAPIAGRIGDSLVPVGGLVTRAAAGPLTTIVPLNPIWVRFQVSESEYLGNQNKAKADLTTLPLELVLADGSRHPQEGRIRNTVNQVDARTGTIEVQATFPNPRHNLLPGQFGRIRFRVDERRQALLIPQRAVQELQGNQAVMTVGSENKVVARAIVPGDRIGDRWVVQQGLKAGDRVIVEGTMKARPGSPVTPKPWKPERKK